MIYTQLEREYKYNTIAEAIYAREVEYFHYDFDKVNFEYLLETDINPEFKTNISERLESTLNQMQNVEVIIAALLAQIDDESAYAQAVERVIAKRKEKAE